jgi:DNA polymerase III subunit delta
VRISTEQLAQHLARELKPLYTVYGDETLLAIEATDRIRAKARGEGHAERAVLTADTGFKWSELSFASRSQSLFSARRILEIRVPTGKPGVEGAAALDTYCEALPPDTVTIVHLPGLEWRAQKAAWFEGLERAGVVVEAKEVTRKALPGWLAGRLKAQQQEADHDTLDFIADRVEGNLLAAYQEVQKLALLFPEGKISFDQVRDAVLDVARYDVFKLGEPLLEGDAVRLARTLDGLRGEGIAPPLVLWAIAEEIRAIGRVLDAMASDVTPPALWREAKIWGASHQALMQQNARRFTREQIESAIAHAAKTDRTIKGLIRGDAWDELLQLGLRFANGARVKALPKRGKMSVPAQAAERAQTSLF